MDNEKAVILLIEDELYRYIRIINENYSGKEAEKLIQDFTKEFKETVLKKYPIEDIDGLIESTLSKINKGQERDN